VAATLNAAFSVYVVEKLFCGWAVIAKLAAEGVGVGVAVGSGVGVGVGVVVGVGVGVGVGVVVVPPPVIVTLPVLILDQDPNSGSPVLGGVAVDSVFELIGDPVALLYQFHNGPKAPQMIIYSPFTKGSYVS
jgi:hypothetical protein